jgi:hypothetical protein
LVPGLQELRVSVITQIRLLTQFLATLFLLLAAGVELMGLLVSVGALVAEAQPLSPLEQTPELGWSALSVRVDKVETQPVELRQPVLAVVVEEPKMLGPTVQQMLVVLVVLEFPRQ